jgi:hypothetical protein
MKASFWQIVAFIAGLINAFVLYTVLTPEYPLFTVVLAVVVVSIAFLPLLYFQGRIALFGATAASLLMAIYSCGKFFLWYWYEFLPAAEKYPSLLTGLGVLYPPIIFYNIFRSLLFASLFGFLERSYALQAKGKRPWSRLQS